MRHALRLAAVVAALTLPAAAHAEPDCKGLPDLAVIYGIDNDRAIVVDSTLPEAAKALSHEVGFASQFLVVPRFRLVIPFNGPCAGSPIKMDVERFGRLLFTIQWCILGRRPS